MGMTSSEHTIFDNACTNDITQSCPPKNWHILCATGKIMLLAICGEVMFQESCVSLSIYNFITSL